MHKLSQLKQQIIAVESQQFRYRKTLSIISQKQNGKDNVPKIKHQKSDKTEDDKHSLNEKDSIHLKSTHI